MASRALVIVDIQDDYFPGGAYPLVAPEAAAANAARVLAAFRERGGEDAVIHVQHVGGAEDPFFVPGTPGVEIHADVAPRPGEAVIQKAAPNSFLGTELEATLRERGVEELVVCGMQSSMCVDATVRAAADLGFSVALVHDACAAPDLEFDGRTVPGATVHDAFMSALGSAYATLVSADEAAAQR